MWALLVLAALLVAACGSGTGASDQRTLTIALAEEPDDLDPTTATTFVGRMVFASMCEKLYDVSPEGTLVPQLATTLPVASDGGKTLTIRLRDGVRFNDGTPLTAAAVKTTLDRDRTLETSARAAEVASIDRVEVTGPRTVVLRLKAPAAPLTAALADRAGMVLSPTQLKKLGDKKFGTDPVCVGPFSFDKRVASDRIELVKSRFYYDRDKVSLDRLVYKIISEGPVRASNLRSGDVDAAERLEPADVVSIENDPGVRLRDVTSPGYIGVTINTNNAKGVGKGFAQVDSPLAKHPELRKAFDLALDRDVIAKVAFFGEVVPGCSPISPSSTWKAVALPCPRRDLAEAKRLVLQSGVKTPIPVRLMAESSTQNQRLAQVIQAMEAEAGFAVKIDATEFTTSLDRADAGDFDTYISGWSGRTDPDGNLFNLQSSDGALNYGGQHDTRFDALLQEARVETDRAKRTRLYVEAVKRSNSNRNVLVMYHDKIVLGTRAGVSGAELRPDALPRVAFARKAEGG